MKSDYLPLSERYRPRVLGEIVGQGAIIPILKRFVSAYRAGNPSMPHLLFSGPPGCGKTTAAMALGRELFGDEWRLSFLELNASDERGIGVVRETIKGYAEKIPGNVPFNIILLDEADAMTGDAMAALKRVVEKNVSTCRFVLTVNEENLLLEAIRDRCVRLPFRPVSEADALPILERAAREGGAKPTREELATLYEMCHNSMRNALDTLGALLPDFDLALLPKTSSPAPQIIKAAKAGKVQDAEKEALKWIREGATVTKVFQGLFDAAVAEGMVPWRLGEYEKAVRSGSSLEFQIRCWIWEVAKNGV
jgi:replication factor C small subunit